MPSHTQAERRKFLPSSGGFKPAKGSFRSSFRSTKSRRSTGGKRSLRSFKRPKRRSKPNVRVQQIQLPPLTPEEAQLQLLQRGSFTPPASQIQPAAQQDDTGIGGLMMKLQRLFGGLGDVKFQ